MQQEVILAMLAKEPSHGYELRARLRQALGPLGDAMNDGHVYVTLTRLEKAGLVTSEQAAGLPDRPDRWVYGLSPAGQVRVWPTRCRSSTPSDVSCCAGCATPSAPRWPSRTARPPGCCSRASCCDCRPTCAGWRPANGTGPPGRTGHERAGGARCRLD